MSFSDEVQQYLLARPPQSVKPGKHTGSNLQIQRLLPLTRGDRARIQPLLNLDTHAVRKTRVIETETGTKLYKFERNPSGVVGKWQVDLRRGDGGGYIFVGKYERYEWARQVVNRSEQQQQAWRLVRSTYSHSKSKAAAKRSGTKVSEMRSSIDDTSSERKLSAKVKISGNDPPMITISPRHLKRNTTDDNSKMRPDDVEAVNKEEVMNALIQGLWIVWREGIVEDTTTTSQAGNRKRKKSALNKLVCWR